MGDKILPQTILVVMDDYKNYMREWNQLLEFGASVTLAPTYLDALEAMDKKRFDYLILDARLPQSGRHLDKADIETSLMVAQEFRKRNPAGRIAAQNAGMYSPKGFQEPLVALIKEAGFTGIEWHEYLGYIIKSLKAELVPLELDSRPINSFTIIEGSQEPHYDPQDYRIPPLDHPGSHPDLGRMHVWNRQKTFAGAGINERGPAADPQRMRELQGDPHYLRLHANARKRHANFPEGDDNLYLRRLQLEQEHTDKCQR